MNQSIADALAGRTGLAGVQWLLLDPGPQDALRHVLGSLLPSHKLGGCQLHRAKYKPGRYLTAYYEANVRDVATDKEIVRQVEVSWTPPGSKDRRGAMPALLAMQAWAIDAGLAAPFRQLIGEAPDWEMRLQIAPLDVEFPQLVRVCEPSHVRTMLAAIALADRYAVTAVRYRPGQRHVLRYDPADEHDGTGAVFAKIYNSDNGARTLAVVRTVAGWLDSHGEGMTAVRPTAYLADDGAVLYPHVSGTPLSQLLRAPGPATERYLRQAGAAIHAMHRTPTTLVELQPHSFAMEVKGIASACEHIRTLAPAAGALIAEMIARANSLRERLPQEPPGFAYGDFKADHLWIRPGGELTLIDFDTCYLADQAIDLGKFLADLHWWHDVYRLPGVEQNQAALLAGYGDLPNGRMARARLYEVLVLIKCTARRVALFDRDWEERTERLIGRADGLLSDLERR